jgi:hypothetical protein
MKTQSLNWPLHLRNFIYGSKKHRDSYNGGGFYTLLIHLGNILLMLIVIFVTSCSSTKNISKSLPDLNLSDSDFVVFGYIDPFLNVQKFQNGEFSLEVIGSYGGVAGAMMRASSPVMVNMVFTNVKTNKTITYSIPEKGKVDAFYSVSLPLGEYYLSINSTTIDRYNKGPVKDKCNIVPISKIVYYGDLTVMTGVNSNNCFIRHEFKNESVEKFINSYPNFKNVPIHQDSCINTIFIKTK